MAGNWRSTWGRTCTSTSPAGRGPCTGASWPPSWWRSWMRPSRRLERIPPYLFAELERKITAKREAGVDVINLGIGDPDMPTYEPIVAAAQRAVADPSTHQYPTNRGTQEFRDAVAAFYERRFGVSLDPDSEVMP